VQQVQVLEQEVQALMAQAAPLLVLQEQVATLTAAAQEVSSLQAQVAHLQPVAEQLEVLRREHSNLLAATAEASLLQRDAEVLRLKADIKRQLDITNGDSHMDAALGPVTQHQHQAESGSKAGTETEGHDSHEVAAPNGNAGDALENLFTQLRASEAAKLGLVAENAELHSKVEQLTAALENSQEAISRLRDIASVVGRIRSAGTAAPAMSFA
jgi:DNA repair exonuclease SbcCD ATPase subunit